MSIQTKITVNIISYALAFLIKIFKIFINGPIEIISRFKGRTKCPPITDDLLYITATELAKKIRKGEIKSETIITAYINRITQVNPVINAVIENRFVDALTDARKADELVSSKKYTEHELESKFPLLGLPVTVKSSIAVEGMIFVSGRYYEDLNKRRAAEDADVVRRVREAGGIILLISSCPEMCFNIESFNKIIGTTRNPYDTRRTSGGSSGGEAALLSTGASLIGIGSDIAGSCRLPAAFCGVFGHKSSGKAVSVEGHFPSCEDTDKWTDSFVLGPMVRYAEDLPLLMNVLRKPEKADTLKITEKVDVSKIKIYYRYDNAGDNFTDDIPEDIRNKIKSVVDHFKSVGCYTEEVHQKYFQNSTLTALIKLLSIDDVDDVFDKQPKSLPLELIKTVLNLNDYSLSSLFYLTGRKFYKSLATKHSAASLEKSVDYIKDGLCGVLKDDGVFIYPAYTGPAFFHRQGIGNFFNAAYMAVANALAMPATSCPVGCDSQGLPLGIQVIGNVNCDRLTFAIAQEIQKVFGGWKPPPFST